jgi:uncharacterized protein (TIGR00299 family) protein
MVIYPVPYITVEMRVLVFDPFHGAAGDMILGALLQVGADRGLVERAMGSVAGPPEIRELERCGVMAISVHTNTAPTRRTLEEVLARVRRGDAPPAAIAMAERVFRRLSAAEMGVHGAGISHFHEVGADDAVAEVLGACTALNSLGPVPVRVGLLALGGGVAESEHGKLPVPAPATLRLLQGTGIRVFTGDHTDGELCTPTGAALLAEFVSESSGYPGAGRILAIGYGAGDRDSAGIPNVLRVILMDVEESLTGDVVDILETNVDDVSGEVLAAAIARMMDAGARDASAIPCMMKKGRPGFLVRVIAQPALSGALAAELAQELGTLGIRCIPSIHRFTAKRTIEVVTIEINGHRGEIPVRCGWIESYCFSLKAEFDAVRDFADLAGIPVREVASAAEEAWRRLARRSENDNTGG